MAFAIRGGTTTTTTAGTTIDGGTTTGSPLAVVGTITTGTITMAGVIGGDGPRGRH